MSKLRRGRVQVLVVALWLGAFLLLSCQPTQPVATPKPAEKAVATPAKPAGTPVAAATKPAATAKPAEKAAEKPVRGGTLRLSHFSDPETLNMPLAPASSAYPGYSIVEPPIQLDADGNLTKEGLFKDWTVSGDGKVLTFKLQTGAKFHDGTDLDAAAVKFNIDWVKDPANKSLYRTNYDSVVSVEVVDGLTVRFNLKQPDPLLLPRLGTQGAVMNSPTAVQKLGVDFGRKPVGSSAFQFVEWVPGDHISMKRFDGYWRKDKDGNQLPYLDGVVFQIIPDQSVAMASLRAGQIDALNPPVAGFPPELMPGLKADANLTYAVRQQIGLTGVYLYPKRPPFDNKALRQAVALALDRQGIAGRLGETAIAAASLLHPLSWAYDGKAGMYPARDVTKAKAKMAEAGYPSGGLKVKATTMNQPVLMTDAEIIKANLAEIGIDVEIEVLAISAWSDRVGSGRGDYQMSEAGIVSGLSDPGHTFGLGLHSKGTRNLFGGTGNPQADQLIDKAGSIYDQKERTTLYQQAATALADEVLFIPLHVPNLIFAMSKKVRDFPLPASSIMGFGLGRTWLAK